jgi:hypothetical protein
LRNSPGKRRANHDDEPQALGKTMTKSTKILWIQKVGPVQRSERNLLFADRATDGAMSRSIHNHELVDKLSRRLVARCKIRQTIKSELAAKN